MRQVMALVLAGGGSERLSVLTAERAVSAVPFAGKYRVIDFVLSNCCHSEIRQVGPGYETKNTRGAALLAAGALIA